MLSARIIYTCYKYSMYIIIDTKYLYIIYVYIFICMYISIYVYIYIYIWTITKEKKEEISLKVSLLSSFWYIYTISYHIIKTSTTCLLHVYLPNFQSVITAYIDYTIHGYIWHTIYEIMKTMFPSVYDQNGFVATHAFWHMTYGDILLVMN